MMDFHKFGKHGDMCRKLHVNQICENPSCKVMCCLKRHPKHCKFYKNYKRCKFDPCAFLHTDDTDTFEYLKKENQSILLKLNENDKSIKALKAKEIETENLIGKLLEIEKKIEIFTNIRQDIHTKDEIIDDLRKKVTEMDENLKEKENLINDLVLRINIVEDKQKDSEKEIEKEDVVIDENDESETVIAATNENNTTSTSKDVKETEGNHSCEKSTIEKVFECNICTYKTKSEHGIKIHKAKKHTHTCRCCNKTFSDQDEYSNHTTECYSTYNYYHSPMMSPVQFPPRFPPRFPHGSPSRFPPIYPPRSPRSPLY